jgi:tetratricopeptide (TPR) repeat protein
MKIKFAAIILSLAVVSAGCGGASNENVNAAAAEVPAEQQQTTQVSEIADANAALAEGNRLFDENMTEEAIAAYRRAIELDPTIAEPYFKLGIALSLIESEQMRAGTGEYVPGEANVAKNYKPESVKMFEKAVEAYKKYLNKNEKDAVAHYNLGLTYNKLNLDKEAEEAFEDAVKLRPEDAEFQTELGGIRVKLAKYREAIGPLKKALELDPENSQAANFLDDAEAGARRVEFNQPDNTNTAKKPASSGGSASSSSSNSSSSNTSSPRSANSEAPSKPAPPRQTPQPRQTPRPN